VCVWPVCVCVSVSVCVCEVASGCDYCDAVCSVLNANFHAENCLGQFK
jgi:hypothetical protein